MSIGAFRTKGKVVNFRFLRVCAITPPHGDGHTAIPASHERGWLGYGVWPGVNVHVGGFLVVFGG